LALGCNAVLPEAVPESIMSPLLVIPLLQLAVLGALLGNRYKGSPVRAEGALRKGQCITISIFG
jgi:hypothetical protein